MPRAIRSAAIAAAVALPLPATAETTPAEVAREFFAAIEARDLDAMLALHAPDAVQTMPFQASGETADEALPRLDGVEAIGGYWQQASAVLPEAAFVDVLMIEGADGESVVVEARGDMTTADGRPYDNRYVWVLRVEDGRITEVREYFNPVTAALAFGLPIGEAAATD